VKPRSRGTVVAASAHPLSSPSISYRYLEDARDRAALRLGVRLAAGLRGPAAAAMAVGAVVADQM